MKTSSLKDINFTNNFWHLAPGRRKYLWDDLKNCNQIGYEWCGNIYGDLNKLSKKKHRKICIINKIKKKDRNFQQTLYFSKIKKGDYICVISGKEFLGIAEAKNSYNYSIAKKNYLKLKNIFQKNGINPFQTINVKWIDIFEKPLILTTIVQPTFTRLNGNKQGKEVFSILNKNGYIFRSINDYNDDEVFGTDIRIKKHIKKELNLWKRDYTAVKIFKAKYAKFGCRACLFKANKKYKFIVEQSLLELHHIEPLSYSSKIKAKFKEKDVSLLCPNCHRAIHKFMSLRNIHKITIREFKKYILY